VALPGEGSVGQFRTAIVAPALMRSHWRQDMNLVNDTAVPWDFREVAVVLRKKAVGTTQTSYRTTNFLGAGKAVVLVNW
jgi:hypothetical protein